MIKSIKGKGLIYSGNTPLASTIVVEQTGPMQITVRTGEFTDLAGDKYTLASDQVVNLTSDPIFSKSYALYLVGNGAVADINLLYKLNDGVDVFGPTELPGFKNLVGTHEFVLEFELPAGTTDITGVDIFYCTYPKGFPPNMEPVAPGTTGTLVG